MNIYAVRDRLIDYYMHPFAGNNDKDVLAAIAAAINREGNLDAIAQAPHYFEVWRIGKVNDDGHVESSRELLGGCEGLVRPKKAAELHEYAAGPRGANGKDLNQKEAAQAASVT